MIKILNIETSTSQSSVAISVDSQILAFKTLSPELNISGEITLLIQSAAHEAQIPLHSIDAVAINLGPGSYTSLRVGLSVAKAICYALNVPLIGTDTFEILYKSVENESAYDTIMCMVDARRMDVYARVYDVKTNHFEKDEFATLDESFFSHYKGKHILCTGDGAKKISGTSFLPESSKISEITQNAAMMATISHEKYNNGTLLDIAYSVPYYFKSPNITTPKNIF